MINVYHFIGILESILLNNFFGRDIMSIENTKDICVNEENYTWEMQNKILPYISKIKQTGSFQTFDGIR